MVHLGKEQPFERGITCSTGSIDHEATTYISGGSSHNQEDIINEIVKYNDYIKNSNNKYSDYIMDCLRRTIGNDKYDISHDDEINKMSSDEVFTAMMEAHGLLSYSEEIKNWIKEIYKTELN